MTRRPSAERLTAALNLTSPWLEGAACTDAAVVNAAEIQPSTSSRGLAR